MLRSNLKNVLLIGMGNLGTRYLQGLMKTNYIDAIYCVDPHLEARDLARTRMMEVLNPTFDGDVKLLAKMPTDQSFDLMISTTCADVRYESSHRAILQNDVKKVILEKVVFQKPTEYAKFADFLKSYAIPGWVNCPRRTSEVYSLIKHQLNLKIPIKITVSGGSWGLLCNSIHFIDLFLFLTNSNSVSNVKLTSYGERFQSKRNGFIEAFGNLSLQNEGSTLQVECTDSTNDLIVMIKNGNQIFTINETKGFIKTVESITPFSFMYQSELTKLVVEEILLTNKSMLPSFAETYQTHVAFLKAVTTALGGFDGFTDDIVPIT
jgi:hypothetical protein